MTVVLLSFLAYCLITAKYKNPFKNEYHDDNFSKDSTDCVNGIFVVLVFLSHFHWEIEQFYKIDVLYNKVQVFLGQCIVCSFLFYSGYGIYEKLKFNRKEYTKKIVLVKLPRLLVRFDLCVILYAIVQYCMGNHFSLQDFLFSLLTIKNLGNSNWYITYIFLMYISIFLSFSVSKDDRVSLFIIIIINFIYSILMYLLNPVANHYYITSFILPMGMYFSKYKSKIENCFPKKIFIFLVLLLFYIVCYLLKAILKLNELTYNMISVLFTLTLVFMTYTIKFNNKLLKILGSNVFQVYIIQHLPMIIFKPIQKTCGGGYIQFFLLCVIGTSVLTFCINYIFMIIDNVIKRK